MKKYVSLFLRIVVAIVLIQTLRFKFTAHPDSVFIFKTLGLEPYGRIGIGILELIAGSLLLIPKTIWTGALLSIGVIFGAIISHLTILGIKVNNDGGMLFYTALLTFTMSCIILYIHRETMPF